MVTKPVHLLKTYGGVYKLFERPRETNTLKKKATLTAYQGQEEVIEASKTPYQSSIASARGRLCPVCIRFRRIHALKDKTFSLLLSIGLHIHETKGHHVATQVGDRLGMTLDFECGVFRPPIEKLKEIAKLATHLL